MSITRKITFYLSIFVLLVAGLGFTAQPAQAAACAKYHIVKKGEYLAKIASYYGVTWRYIADINHLKNPSRIYAGNKLCVLLVGDEANNGDNNGDNENDYEGFPTFSIVSVVEDEDVTVKTYNLPPHDSFDVLMGEMGTKGKGGIKVDTINTGSGGSKQYVFDIPKALRGEYQIAIRLQSNTGSDYFAYNWFYNNTNGGGGTGGGYKPPKGYTGFPTFSILSVIRNEDVTIQAYNLPPDDSFNVYMGPMGTKGVGGIKVDEIDTGSGGSKQYTFDIPSALKGSYQISIRLQSTSGSGYFAFNWFYNNTAVDP
ncbi:MAG TPA: LysM domain-containing protein [Anaerolineales bacterium]|nr:LysM domain-containing protein [Anaerolineales bacterium]